MINHPNIDPSGFRHGVYTGYAGGRVYRIRHLIRGWAGHATDGHEPAYIYAPTLSGLGDKLAALPVLKTGARHG